MKKMNVIFTYALLLLLINISSADIAPKTLSISGVFLPPDSADFNSGNVFDIQSAVDVSMAAETVLVDLYPTFIKVKAVFLMKGGKRGERNLTTGFPEAIYKHLSSRPLDYLTITVNDKKVTPYFHADKIYGQQPATLWWLFNMDVPPGKDVKVVVSYYQLLHNKYGYSDNIDKFLSGTTQFMCGYILRTGALWKDNIGHAKIKLITHGNLDRYLKLYPTPHKSSNNIYEWEYSDWSPKSDLSIILDFPNKYIDSVSSGIAPYNFENISPRIRLIDRILRFSRSPFLTEEKIDVLMTAVMDAANQDDDYELKIYARKVLEFFRNNVKEYAKNLYIDLDIVVRERITKEGNVIITEDLRPGIYFPDDWDDLFFRTGTTMGTFLHNMTIKNALSLLTPAEIIEIDSSFVQDRLYKDGMTRFKSYAYPLGGQYSENGIFAQISEDFFMSLRQRYRTIIMIVIGLISTLFLFLIYFAWKYYKNKFRKK